MTQDVAAQSAANDTRYCVMHLPRDPARRDRKQRFAYSLSVLHFRKRLNNAKPGSGRNREKVIYPRGYMNVNYQAGDGDGRQL
ncbi:hypothetical protein FQA38_22965 [Salmonella enterica]|nr:hypothetical protein [Salmonella enterica]